MPLAAVLLPVLGCGTTTPSSGIAGSPAVVPGAVHTAPTAGYLWFAGDQTLRPILGVPGASRVGASLVPGGLYVTGAASPVNSTALLVDKAGTLSALLLPAGSATSLGNGYTASAHIRFAPGGTSAVVFVPGAASLLVVTGLPSAPVTHLVPAPAALTDAAIADSGSLLTAATTAQGVAIGLVRGGSTITLTTVARFGGFAPLPGADSALVVDNAAQTLTLWAELSTTPARVAIPVATIHNAVAVGSSRDGRWALIANGGDTNLIRVDLSGVTSPTATACLCQPSGVEPLAGNAVFRVSQPNAATPQLPTWTIDAASVQPRLLFIPARAPEGN